MGNVTSVKERRRFFPIHHLCASLSDITCKVPPAAHALTGCDTTSSFFGISNKSVLKVLKETADYFKDIEKLGNPDKDEAFTCSRKFVARRLIMT